MIAGILAKNMYGEDGSTPPSLAHFVGVSELLSQEHMQSTRNQPFLKGDMCTELDNTRIAGCRTNDSCTGRVEARAWQAKVRMVEDVQSVSSHLKIRFSSNVQRLPHGSIRCL